uniref:Uncharacterized protein n=1 Tax=Picea glauca TaxID=3330 RepID=A0A124GN07_PICGL|nr:hypothetical protein ABT39_MTgene5533 [Picea glauca]
MKQTKVGGFLPYLRASLRTTTAAVPLVCCLLEKDGRPIHRRLLP